MKVPVPPDGHSSNATTPHVSREPADGKPGDPDYGRPETAIREGGPLAIASRSSCCWSRRRPTLGACRATRRREEAGRPMAERRPEPRPCARAPPVHRTQCNDSTFLQEVT